MLWDQTRHGITLRDHGSWILPDENGWGIPKHAGCSIHVSNGQCLKNDDLGVASFQETSITVGVYCSIFFIVLQVNYYPKTGHSDIVPVQGVYPIIYLFEISHGTGFAS